MMAYGSISCGCKSGEFNSQSSYGLLSARAVLLDIAAPMGLGRM